MPAATTECEQLFPEDDQSDSFFDMKIDAFERALQLNLTGTVLPRRSLPKTWPPAEKEPSSTSPPSTHLSRSREFRLRRGKVRRE